MAALVLPASLRAAVVAAMAALSSGPAAPPVPGSAAAASVASMTPGQSSSFSMAPSRSALRPHVAMLTRRRRKRVRRGEPMEASHSSAASCGLATLGG